MYERRNNECDGNPKGLTRLDQAPCHYRNKCVALAIHCSTNHVARDTLVNVVTQDGSEVAVARHDPSALETLLVLGVKKYRIKDGISAAKPAATSGRSIRAATPATRPVPRDLPPKSRPYRNPRPGVVDVEGRAFTEGIANHFFDLIRRKLGRDIVGSRAEATPGQMYLVDRRERSNYCSVYVKSRKGAMVALVVIYFKPNFRCIEIKVAAEYNEFIQLVSALNQGRLKTEDCTGRDGSFKVWFRRVDKAGSGIIADALASAVRSGIILLPAAVTGV